MSERRLLESALEALRSASAEGDAYLEHRRTLEVSVREGRLEGISRAEVRGLAVRAIRDGRLGFVHTSALDPDGAGRAAREACALAESATPRQDLVLADPAGPGDGRDEGVALGLLDASIEKRPIEEKRAWVLEAESAALGVDARIRRTEGASYSENITGHWIANTRGLYRHYGKSELRVRVEVVAEEGGELQPGDRGARAMLWKQLPEPAALGRGAGERAIRLLGGRPVGTGRYPVVFSPDAGWTLLVYIAVALNGDHLSRGRSWLSEREEAKIGSPLVTIVDDGRHKRGPASAPFDAEGIDTRETVLVERGVIRGRILDLASARRLGLASTGNARRDGYEASPEIGTHNMYLAPGGAAPEAMLSQVDRGLWVWGLSGWWIGLGPSNPNFSSAAYGLWIENGQPVRPVARVTIAGGIEEILGGVEEVADDLVWDHATKTPTFRVASMAVSGT